MSGEDWHVLSQCGEYIFDGLIDDADFKEYLTTLCCIFRLAASKKIVPPMCHPLQLHRIRHLLENVSDVGPVELYWCFRMERIIGRLVSSMNRRSDVEAVMENIVIRSRIGRMKLGTVVVAHDDLENLQTLSVDGVACEIINDDGAETETSTTTREEYLVAIASDILERREKNRYAPERN
eukprot:g38691.t1